jgi:nucleoid-associated protein
MPHVEHEISHLALHRISKTQEEPAVIVLRDEENPVSDPAVRLVEKLCTQYAERSGKGYGRFEDDEDSYPMALYLRQHVVDQRIGFAELSRLMMAHLKLRVDQEALELGGVVLITRIQEGTNDCLWVALIAESVGSAITAGLDVVDCAHLDLAALRVAGRIDLTAWQRGDERYISFLKSRGDVAGYFKQFLGCNDVVIALKETQKLVQTLTRFADDEKLAAPARDVLMERAHAYLDELGENGAPLGLDVVAREVWPDAPERLDAALHDDALNLASGFVPDRRAIKPLVRFKASAEQWKIEFDRASLRSGAVHYDRDNGTLVLSEVPDYLRRMLLDE